MEVWTAEDYRKYLDKQKPSKYRNKRVKFDGYSFDSQAEANRYAMLRILWAAGEIQELEVHPKYTVQEAFTRAGKSYWPITYEADFQYLENGKQVVEDVKGAQTEVFRLKMKMLLFKWPDIDFRLVKVK